MRIVELLGSPRPRGNTANVLDLFEEALGPGHEIERIVLDRRDLKGCLGCNACQRVLDAPGCVRGDEGLAIFEEMLRADLLVYATPLYCWSYSAQLKMLIDRHFCLCKWDAPEAPLSLLAGRRAALLVTCADAVEGNADLLPALFERQAKVCHCDLVGCYVVAGCGQPPELPPEARVIAMRMAQDVGARWTWPRGSCR